MANLARDMRLAWRLLTDWERWALIGAPLALISAYTLYQLSDALGVVWFVLIGLFVGIVGGAAVLVAAVGFLRWSTLLFVMPLYRRALLQRLAAVRGRLSLCADQAAAAKWWLSMPMASVSAEGPMPKALSTRRTSPLMPGCRHQGRACPLRRARMTSNPLIVA